MISGAKGFDGIRAVRRVRRGNHNGVNVGMPQHLPIVCKNGNVRDLDIGISCVIVRVKRGAVFKRHFAERVAQSGQRDVRGRDSAVDMPVADAPDADDADA